MCLFISLYLCHGRNKAAGKTQIKQKAQQRGKMREREREKEPLSISCNLTVIFVMKKT